MAKQRTKLLIVDGCNVLRSGSRYRRAPDEDYTDDTFNAAREKLINDVVNYAGRDYKAVIVFDGAKNEFSNGEAEKIGGVRIVFSPAGQSADRRNAEGGPEEHRGLAHRPRYLSQAQGPARPGGKVGFRGSFPFPTFR